MNDEEPSAIGQPIRADPVLTQSARLLRPLVRLCIKAGIIFPALSNLLRQIYVSVAEAEFSISDRELSDSRISILTGLHRREIRRLGEVRLSVSDVPAALSLSSQVLARWTGLDAFTDANGHPLPLRRASTIADEPSFVQLVQLVTKDVRPRVVLDDWLAQGLIKIDSEGRLVLQQMAMIPKPGQSEQFYYFGRNLHDHMAASVSNVLASGPVHFERAVHYSAMSKEAAADLCKEATDVAMSLLLAVNRQALEIRENTAEGDWRWTLGVYVYSEEKSSEAE